MEAALVACPCCQTAYHPECADALRTCALLGCTGDLDRLPREAPPPPRSDWSLWWVLLGPALVPVLAYASVSAPRLLLFGALLAILYAWSCWFES